MKLFLEDIEKVLFNFIDLTLLIELPLKAKNSSMHSVLNYPTGLSGIVLVT